MKRTVSLLSVAIGAVVLAGCSLLGITTIAKPTNVTATAAGDSFALTWTAVSGATSYNIYYTSDGSSPSTSSTKVTGITGTSNTIGSLSPTSSYSFRVAAVENGQVGQLSTATSAAQPLAVITITANYGTYTSQPAGAVLLTASTSSGTKTATAEKITTTDSSGNVTFTFPLKQGTYYGVALFEDTNADGSLTAGDDVWGGKGDGSSYSFLSYGNAISNDVTLTFNPWQNSSPAPAAATM